MERDRETYRHIERKAEIEMNREETETQWRQRQIENSLLTLQYKLVFPNRNVNISDLN